MSAGQHRPVVSSRYPRIRTTTANVDQKVVVVLTEGRIDRKSRAEFDRQTQRVVDGMAQQPGLLGYSVRRQLFGSTVWTFTIWESDQARARFVASPTHRRAIADSGAAVLAMRSWRADLVIAQMPTSWAEALTMFADAGSRAPSTG